MNGLETIKKWHQTKVGLTVFCLAELALFYAMFCLAIDQGNLLWYLGCLIFLVGAIKNFSKLIRSIIHALR